MHYFQYNVYTNAPAAPVSGNEFPKAAPDQDNNGYEQVCKMQERVEEGFLMNIFLLPQNDNFSSKNLTLRNFDRAQLLTSFLGDSACTGSSAANAMLLSAITMRMTISK